MVTLSLICDRNNHTKSFNVEVDTEPTRIVGRVLPRVSLVKSKEPREHLFHWGVLNMSSKLSEEQINMYLETLIRLKKYNTFIITFVSFISHYCDLRLLKFAS